MSEQPLSTKVVKVLYLTTGGSIHDHRFLVKLLERGYDTCYAYLEPGGRKYEMAGLRACYLGPGSVENEEYPVNGCNGSPKRLRLKDSIPEPLLKMLRPFKTLKLYYLYYRNLKRLLREFKPDILHAGWVIDAGFIAALSGFKPLLLMPMGSDILIYPNRGYFYRALVRFSIRRSDMITCDAEGVKKRVTELTRYPPKRIGVFPRGIDLNLFMPNKRQRDKVRSRLGWTNNKILIMTRSFKPVYSVSDFIQALPKVFANHPEARALFIGTGPLEKELKTLASELGLIEKVKFLGAVENKELPAYLNAADLYVSSSLSDGTSLSLLEALACALPVVVTDVPTNLEWIEDGVNGRVAPRRDPSGLARALIDLLKDNDMMLKAASANLNLAKSRADWNLNFTNLEGIYHTLINRFE